MKVHTTGKTRNDSTAAFAQVQQLQADLKVMQGHVLRLEMTTKHILAVLNEAEDDAGSGLEWELKDFKKGKPNREALLAGEDDEEGEEDEDEEDDDTEGDE